jgi:hypothetical protein
MVARTQVLATSDAIITARRGSRSPIDAAEGEHRHLGDRPGREGQADVGRVAAAVQDGEGDRDRCEVRPDVGDRPSGEEEPEVAVAERLHDRMLTG